MPHFFVVNVMTAMMMLSVAGVGGQTINLTRIAVVTLPPNSFGAANETMIVYDGTGIARVANVVRVGDRPMFGFWNTSSRSSLNLSAATATAEDPVEYKGAVPRWSSDPQLVDYVGTRFEEPRIPLSSLADSTSTLPVVGGTTARRVNGIRGTAGDLGGIGEAGTIDRTITVSLKANS